MPDKSCAKYLLSWSDSETLKNRLWNFLWKTEKNGNKIEIGPLFFHRFFIFHSLEISYPSSIFWFPYHSKWFQGKWKLHKSTFHSQNFSSPLSTFPPGHYLMETQTELKWLKKVIDELWNRGVDSYHKLNSLFISCLSS